MMKLNFIMIREDLETAKAIAASLRPGEPMPVQQEEVDVSSINDFPSLHNNNGVVPSMAKVQKKSSTNLHHSYSGRTDLSSAEEYPSLGRSSSSKSQVCL